MNSQIHARCSIKQRASLNKTTSVVLLSDGRGFNFSSFCFSLFILHSPSFYPLVPKFSYGVSPFTFDCFLLFLRLVWPPALGAFTFPVGYFAPPLRLLCSVSSATLPRFFSYLAPSLRAFSAFFSEALPFPLRKFGALLREGRGRREEDGRRAGKKVPSEVTSRGEESAGGSCPENYRLRGGVEAINSYI